MQTIKLQAPNMMELITRTIPEWYTKACIKDETTYVDNILFSEWNPENQNQAAIRYDSEMIVSNGGNGQPEDEE